MKICLISFDQWKYDHYIVEALLKLGIDANHIIIGKFKYKYPTPFHRIYNALSKIFFGKNIKKIKRQLNILEQLEKMGKQDKILVINPEVIDIAIHNKIKAYTPEYIAYLYDSSERNPIGHLLDGLFDRIYSFDAADVEKYGFLPLSNYIYLEKKTMRPVKDFKYAVFMILTVDERHHLLNSIAGQLDRKKINYKFIIVGSRKPKGLNPNIEFRRNRIDLLQLEKHLEESAVFLDIIREKQVGLSFRVFESLAFQKKLITTNVSVKNYSFYNPDNILVLDDGNSEIPDSFFETPYRELPENIYFEHTLENWVKKAFNIAY